MLIKNGGNSTKYNVSLVINHPIPVIDELFVQLGDIEYVSLIGLANALLQVVMAPEERHKLSFVTRSGKFEYTRCCFGLRNFPPRFARLINHVLSNLHPMHRIMSYLDDGFSYINTRYPQRK